MTELFAQPYDISAQGFYFHTADEYREKAAKARNAYGSPVEEYEILFIDGEDIDARLFKALSISQGTFARFFEICDEWDEWQKRKVILAAGECGHAVDLSASPDDIDIDIYELDSLKDLAEHFVDEGLFGDIPERLQNYLDYDAIARDLGFDYSEAAIAGKRLVYRCA